MPGLRSSEREALEAAGFGGQVLTHLDEVAQGADWLDKARMAAHPAWAPAIVLGTTFLAPLVFLIDWRIAASLIAIFLITAGLTYRRLHGPSVLETSRPASHRLIALAIRGSRLGGAEAEAWLRRSGAIAAAHRGSIASLAEIDRAIEDYFAQSAKWPWWYTHGATLLPLIAIAVKWIWG